MLVGFHVILYSKALYIGAIYEFDKINFEMIILASKTTKYWMSNLNQIKVLIYWIFVIVVLVVVWGTGTYFTVTSWDILKVN